MTLFAKVPTELDFPAEEGAILQFWKERKIFEKSLEERDGKPTFVFYEGPPTANGMPHNGHVLTRVVKDLFPRYKTMRGYKVPRKAGWDTHGLPVEVEVEKELRIHGKAAIEAYGVEPFVAKCIQSVFRYTSEWETLTDRVAFWCDLEDAYVTYHKEYVESVWWALSELLKKGLLYRGHKVVWWWAQGGTALSARRRSASGTSRSRTPASSSPSRSSWSLASRTSALLVWTTTPWTLPSNMYAAVNREASPTSSVKVTSERPRRSSLRRGQGPHLETLGKKLEAASSASSASCPARSWWVKSYDSAVRSLSPAQRPSRAGVCRTKVYSASSRRTSSPSTSGTGIVHMAPAFGEDDMLAHRALYGTSLRGSVLRGQSRRHLRSRAHRPTPAAG